MYYETTIHMYLELNSLVVQKSLYTLIFITCVYTKIFTDLLDEKIKSKNNSKKHMI